MVLFQQCYMGKSLMRLHSIGVNNCSQKLPILIKDLVLESDSVFDINSIGPLLLLFILAIPFPLYYTSHN